jgi:ferredoxin
MISKFLKFKTITKLTSRDISASKDFLKNHGYNSKTIDKIINSFPTKNPSLKEIELLGHDGLESLVLAIEREEVRSKPIGDFIELEISIPHEKKSLIIKARVGQSLYDLKNSEIGQLLEFACNGIAACSTCHVIIDKTFYDKLKPPTQAEQDMLDLTRDVTSTSRLGCQLILTKELNGLKLKIPEFFNNLY